MCFYQKFHCSNCCFTQESIFLRSYQQKKIYNNLSQKNETLKLLVIFLIYLFRKNFNESDV
jgi:hypothetical protein